MISDDSVSWNRAIENGAGAVIDALWHDVRRLMVSHLLTVEESEAIFMYINDMRNLEQRLASGSKPAGSVTDRSAGMLELRGMIKILQDDISQARMRMVA